MCGGRFLRADVPNAECEDRERNLSCCACRPAGLWSSCKTNEWLRPDGGLMTYTPVKQWAASLSCNIFLLSLTFVVVFFPFHLQPFVALLDLTLK